MSQDIEDWNKDCKNCLLRKSQTNIRAPIIRFGTKETLKSVSFDYLSLETLKDWHQSKNRHADAHYIILINANTQMPITHCLLVQTYRHVHEYYTT